MSRFNWWRRKKKKPLLKKSDAFIGKSFLLQQIEHGDYDPSDYYDQALYELQLCAQAQEKAKQEWKAGPESLKYELDQIERKYIKRYNKLMEDHMVEEQRLLRNLKEGLQKEFGVDCWYDAIEVDPNQNIKQLYYNYRKIAYEYYQQVEKLELENNSSLPLQVAD